MSYKKENNIEFDRDVSPVENKLTIKPKAKKKEEEEEEEEEKEIEDIESDSEKEIIYRNILIIFFNPS